MQNIIDRFKQGVPASLTAQLNMMEWRDKQTNFAAKYVVTELAFVGTTLTSALEGIAAIIASLVVNALNYVVPKKYDFNTKVVTPVLHYRHRARMAFSYSLAALKNNVATKEPIQQKTIQDVQKFYVKLGEIYDKAYAKAFGNKKANPA